MTSLSPTAATSLVVALMALAKAGPVEKPNRPMPVRKRHSPRRART